MTSIKHYDEIGLSVVLGFNKIFFISKESVLSDTFHFSEKDAIYLDQLNDEILSKKLNGNQSIISDVKSLILKHCELNPKQYLNPKYDICGSSSDLKLKCQQLELERDNLSYKLKILENMFCMNKMKKSKYSTVDFMNYVVNTSLKTIQDDFKNNCEIAVEFIQKQQSKNELIRKIEMNLEYFFGETNKIIPLREKLFFLKTVTGVYHEL